MDHVCAETRAILGQRAMAAIMHSRRRKARKVFWPSALSISPRSTSSNGPLQNIPSLDSGKRGYPVLIKSLERLPTLKQRLRQVMWLTRLVLALFQRIAPFSPSQYLFLSNDPRDAQRVCSKQLL